MHDTTHHHHPDGTPFSADECAGLKVLKEGESLINHSDVFIRKDGTFFDVVYSSSRLMSGNQVTGLVVVFHDVSERNRKEEELRKANADLQHFAYAASHDLQEPLRMVTSYTQLLAKQHMGKLDKMADLAIGYAVEGAHRMEMLLKGLRDYWAVNEGRIEQTAVAAPQDALDEALDYLKTSIEQSGAVITHDPLPATVAAEEMPLTLLFKNLIGNALKYVRPGEPPRIHISAHRNTSVWSFSVQDNGIGIEAEHLGTIFAPFKRLHGAEEYAGSGLGLAICQRIVERFKGRLWVESKPGQGSTFHFTIPAPADEH